MGGIADRVRAIAMTLGLPGLFLVAFLDSSILSLPEIADLALIWMVVQHKERLVIYAATTTAGSVAGCLLMYYIGRKGGDALVRKRFHSASVDRTLASFQKYGVMAVLIPSVLPPPAPFKIFVLLAGVARIRVSQFTFAIVIGRGARYLVEGMLAVWYGEQAITFIHAHAVGASITVAGVLIVALAAYVVWARRRDAGVR